MKKYLLVLLLGVIALVGCKQDKDKSIEDEQQNEYYFSTLNDFRKIERQYFRMKYSRVRKDIREFKEEHTGVPHPPGLEVLNNLAGLNVGSQKIQLKSLEFIKQIKNKKLMRDYYIADQLRQASVDADNSATVKASARQALIHLRDQKMITPQEAVVD